MKIQIFEMVFRIDSMDISTVDSLDSVKILYIFQYIGDSIESLNLIESTALLGQYRTISTYR